MQLYMYIRVYYQFTLIMITGKLIVWKDDCKSLQAKIQWYPHHAIQVILAKSSGEWKYELIIRYADHLLHLPGCCHSPNLEWVHWVWKYTVSDQTAREEIGLQPSDAVVKKIKPLKLHGPFIHSAISIAPLQVLYRSEALPTTARILYRSFTPKCTGNCR